MASFIAAGHTFATGATMTVDLLHQSVESATVTAIPLSEFAAGAGLLHVSSVEPATDQGVGSLWVDTTNEALRCRIVASGPYHSLDGAIQVVNNSATVTILPGEVLSGIAFGDYGAKVSPTVTQDHDAVLGVSRNHINPSATGLAYNFGWLPTRVLGEVTPGDHLMVSATNGVAYSHTASSFGSGTVTLGLTFAQSPVSLPGPGTTTVTMLWFGS